MAKGKINGFFIAMLVAIISFFVIFLFFAPTADKFFGVSIKNGEVDLERLKQNISSEVKEKVEVVSDSAAERLSEGIQDLISK